MIRRVHVQGIMFAIVLTVSQAVLEKQTRSLGQTVPEAGKISLKERDRLREQSQRHHAEGKLAEAIAAAEAVVGIDARPCPRAMTIWRSRWTGWQGCTWSETTSRRQSQPGKRHWRSCRSDSDRTTGWADARWAGRGSAPDRDDP